MRARVHLAHIISFYCINRTGFSRRCTPELSKDGLISKSSRSFSRRATNVHWISYLFLIQNTPLPQSYLDSWHAPALVAALSYLPAIDCIDKMSEIDVRKIPLCPHGLTHRRHNPTNNNTPHYPNKASSWSYRSGRPIWPIGAFSRLLQAGEVLRPGKLRMSAAPTPRDYWKGGESTLAPSRLRPSSRLADL